MKNIFLLLLLISQIGFAQTNQLQEIIDNIEFKEDSIKSIFLWVTDNIKYDVDKLKKIEKGDKKQEINFESKEEQEQYLLNKVIKSQKGVCEDYSLIFNALVTALGYESYIIEGYTKDTNGRLNRRIGHTWNAVKVNNIWRLYDPTWGSGSVENEKKFVKLYSEKWYDIGPEDIQKTHMPFDPIWQLNETPMFYEEFDKNVQSEASRVIYDFNSIIGLIQTKSLQEQLQDQIDRSSEMGEGIALIKKWRKYMAENIGIYNLNSQIGNIDDAYSSSNLAVDYYNKYVNAKNKQFKGKKWDIKLAEQNLMNSKEEVLLALDIFENIKLTDRRSISNMNKAKRNTENLLRQINKEESFLKKYMNK